MPLYDQLIEFAREKQRGRRCAGVHKAVPNPIVVLIIGDKQRESLDTLYTQLVSRWSSRLRALQVCYCYVKAPYTGDSPILQTELELPDAGGPGALCTLPHTLAAVNDMMGQAVDRISQEDQAYMMRADIHVILSPEDPAGALLSDLAAVAKSRLEDFGVITNDCRLYLLLPKTYRTQAECGYVRGVMDQLRGAREYAQKVLQPQPDAPPRICRISRLINAVMLLDDVNENLQHYNVHGERLGLLLDLVEHKWSNTGFVQTAGVRDGTAGPEYWLAQAADLLCAERQAKALKDEDGQLLRTVAAEITAAAQAMSRGADQVRGACCLFKPGQVGYAARLSPEDGEEAVFGGALEAAYKSWRERRPKPELPGAVQEIVERIDSDAGLDMLIGQLEEWINESEKKQTQPPDPARPQLSPGRGEAEAAERFRDYLWQARYLPLLKKEEQSRCAELARLCIRSCRRRKEDLREEEEDFAEFSKEIHQAWVTLRDAYNDGCKMELTWLDKPPEQEALRREGALAFRTGDPTAVLAMVADCVDLSGAEAGGARCADPPLFCRIPSAIIGLVSHVQTITQGVSTGRVLKFAVISQEYDEELLRRVYMLNYAWENQPAE